jgi:hypothetical protein
MLVNSKQKVAALASGLAIATTGLVVSTEPQATPDNESKHRSPAAAAGARDPDHAARLAALLGVPQSAVTDALEEVFGPSGEPPRQVPRGG